MKRIRILRKKTDMQCYLKIKDKKESKKRCEKSRNQQPRKTRAAI